jgi:hypothetical protein
MAEITIEKLDEQEYTVTVAEGNTESVHSVEIPEKLLKRIPEEKREELLKSSFEFLLAREPKETILSSFALSLISTYFPEYDTEVLEKFTS